MSGNKRLINIAIACRGVKDWISTAVSKVRLLRAWTPSEWVQIVKQVDYDADFENGLRVLAAIILLFGAVLCGLVLSFIDGGPRPLVICLAYGYLIWTLTNQPLGIKLSVRVSRGVSGVGRMGRLAIDCLIVAIPLIAAHYAYRALMPLGVGSAFALFILPVILATLFVSTRAAAISAFFAFLYVLYYVIPPIDSFRIESPFDLVSAAVFVATLVAVIYLVRIARGMCSELDKYSTP